MLRQAQHERIRNQVNIVSGVQTPLTTKGDARPPLVTPFISARSKLRGFMESGSS